jgi:outer membrane murein-binding lipoprotein Lpp
MQKLAAELARLQIKVKEKREREAAAKAAAAAANDEAAMFAKLMAEIGELKKELGEE